MRLVNDLIDVIPPHFPHIGKLLDFVSNLDRKLITPIKDELKFGVGHLYIELVIDLVAEADWEILNFENVDVHQVSLFRVPN